MITKLFTFSLIVLSFHTLAQEYIMGQFPEVIINNEKMNFPWAGGINSARIQMLDLNDDGLEDIIAFEISTNESLTFISTGAGEYDYQPQYGELIPKINGWMITRDFNGDGKKDIFTADPLGIRVYINDLPNRFKLYPVTPILSNSTNGPINIYASDQDLPAVEDVDGDGDFDIIAMQFAGTTMEFHKNLQVENELSQDTLIFEKSTGEWGDIKICDCNMIVSSASSCPQSGRIEHSSGHSIVLLDLDEDGDLDLSLSDSQCFGLNYFENTGTSEQAHFDTNELKNILNEQINIPYPRLSYADVDADGYNDILISPTNNGTFNYILDFSKTLWLFRNNGTSGDSHFSLQKQNFLQDEMIDMGLNSHPAFYDIDNDGDQDMFLGTLVDFDNDFRTGLSYFENVGSYGNPSFQLITNDAFGLSRSQIYNLKAQFADVTGDRRPDLIFSSTNLITGQTTLSYIRNTGLVTFNTDYEEVLILSSIPFGANFFVNDLDDDKQPDLLLTSPTGVQRWEKTGTAYSFVSLHYKNLPINTQSILIVDINKDGSEDLLYTTTGEIFVIDDFRNNDTASNISFQYSKGGKLTPLGRAIQIGAANLLGHDTPELIVGNNTGGLKMFSSAEALYVPEADPFVLFPNPAEPMNNLKFESTRNLLLYVISSEGKKILGPEYLPSNKIYELQLKNLSAGMYIIHTLVDNTTSWQRKFIVID